MMIYPHATAPKANESLDYIDEGTLPLRGLHTPSQTQGNSTTENVYTPRPKTPMSSV
jgi:hypothetical protein